jgi:hypothetical protein
VCLEQRPFALVGIPGHKTEKKTKIGSYGDILMSADYFSHMTRLNTLRPAGPLLLNDIHRV